MAIRWSRAEEMYAAIVEVAAGQNVVILRFARGRGYLPAGLNGELLHTLCAAGRLHPGDRPREPPPRRRGDRAISLAN
jgi:hypothetical protein